MLKEAGQLCKATDALPLCALEGGQVTNSSKGTVSLYPLAASHGSSIETDQAQQPTPAQHKRRPPSPTWHKLSRGIKDLCAA